MPMLTNSEHAPVIPGEARLVVQFQDPQNTTNSWSKKIGGWYHQEEVLLEKKGLRLESKVNSVSGLLEENSARKAWP